MFIMNLGGNKMFNMIKRKAKTLIKNQKGQGLVEYALIISGIAMVVFLIFGTLSGQLTATFQSIIDSL